MQQLSDADAQAHFGTDAGSVLVVSSPVTRMELDGAAFVWAPGLTHGQVCLGSWDTWGTFVSYELNGARGVVGKRGGWPLVPATTPTKDVRPKDAEFETNYDRTPFGASDEKYWTDLYNANIEDARNVDDENGNTPLDYAVYIRSLCKVHDYVDFPPLSITDFGCGNGNLLRALSSLFPESTLRGFEPSRWARERRVFDRVFAGNLLEKAPTKEMIADVVISKSVLQYLSDDDLELYVRRLASATRGPAFIMQVMTAEAFDMLGKYDDWAYDRPRSKYEEVLGRYFVPEGFNLYLRKDRSDPRYSSMYFG